MAVNQMISEHLFKVLVIGEYGVGKTAIIRRFVDGTFTPNYKLTIGVDFALKTLNWNDDTRINLQLWDIAGHERFGHMTRVYYKYAIAAIIVFDLSRPATFDSVSKWLDDVHSKVMLTNEEPVPVMLLANKCDVDGVTIDKETMDNFCKTHKIDGWFATSAKENLNIDEAMAYIVREIIKLPSETLSPEESKSITLHNTATKRLFEDSFEEEIPLVKESSCCG